MLRQNTCSEFWPHNTTNQPRREVSHAASRGTKLPTSAARARTLNKRAGGSIVLSNHVSGRTVKLGTRLMPPGSDHDTLTQAPTIANATARHVIQRRADRH